MLHLVLTGPGVKPLNFSGVLGLRPFGLLHPCISYQAPGDLGPDMAQLLVPSYSCPSKSISQARYSRLDFRTCPTPAVECNSSL